MEIFKKIAKPAQVMVASLAISSCSEQSADSPAPEKAHVPVAKRVGLLIPFTSEACETRQIIKPVSLYSAALQVDGLSDLADRGALLKRGTVLNGIHPSTTLVPGTHIRCIRSGYAIPLVDTELGVDPMPVVVSLQKGQTLWELSQTFKVPLNALIATNCRDGEYEVRNLHVGREIIIPMVQIRFIDGKPDFYLEGLCITNTLDCQRIAQRLIKNWYGASLRRNHLATCLQHFSP